jgi:hypothetical protein
MNVTLSLRVTKSAPATAWIAAGVCFFAAPAFGHHLEKHFTVDGHSVVTIHNPNGKITIHSWNKPEVMVSADHASDRVEVDATQMGNRIDLVTHTLVNSVTPEEFEANYQISVPQDAELQIHDDSGLVEVNQVFGDMAVETVGAGVNLGRCRGLRHGENRGRRLSMLALRRPSASAVDQRKCPVDPDAQLQDFCVHVQRRYSARRRVSRPMGSTT